MSFCDMLYYFYFVFCVFLCEFVTRCFMSFCNVLLYDVLFCIDLCPFILFCDVLQYLCSVYLYCYKTNIDGPQMQTVLKYMFDLSK